MAVNYLLQYGIFFSNQTDFLAAKAANGGSVVLTITPNAAVSAYPLGTAVQFGIPYFTSVPGTVILPTYTPVAGTPGINNSPGTVSTGTLTTAVTETTYGSFLNVMSTRTVNYTWQGVLFADGSTLTPTTKFTGVWQQQVVTYTGNGVAGRLVPTTFSLATGVVAVWVFPGVTHGPSFRHNAMSGSAGPSSGIDTNGGIMSFAAGGFTVTDDLGQLRDVNQLGASYTALVISDTTSDNRYMQVGQYAGDASATRTINYGGLFQLTQLWIFGRGGQSVFCSDDFTVGNSVSLGIEAKPVTNQITALGVGQFSIGNDNNVDNVGLTYYYAAFCIPVGNTIRNMFQTYKSPVGTGAAVNVPLNFSPTFGIAREYTVALPSSVWRGPLQTGTISTSYNGNSVASGGIEALGTSLLTLGTTVLPNGENAYGFAMISGSQPNPTVSSPPPGNPLPPGISPPNGSVVITATVNQWFMERCDAKQRNEEHL